MQETTQLARVEQFLEQFTKDKGDSDIVLLESQMEDIMAGEDSSFQNGGDCQNKVTSACVSNGGNCSNYNGVCINPTNNGRCYNERVDAVLKPESCGR